MSPSRNLEEFHCFCAPRTLKQMTFATLCLPRHNPQNRTQHYRGTSSRRCSPSSASATHTADVSSKTFHLSLLGWTLPTGHFFVGLLFHRRHATVSQALRSFSAAATTGSGSTSKTVASELYPALQNLLDVEIKNSLNLPSEWHLQHLIEITVKQMPIVTD